MDWLWVVAALVVCALVWSAFYIFQIGFACLNEVFGADRALLFVLCWILLFVPMLIATIGVGLALLLKIGDPDWVRTGRKHAGLDSPL